jgi:hypothetical protein
MPGVGLEPTVPDGQPFLRGPTLPVCLPGQAAGIVRPRPAARGRSRYAQCGGGERGPAPRPPRVADLSTLPPTAYAYLLGLYLGDGHVVSTGRSYRLTIKLDAAYPGIVEAAAAAVAAVMPGHAVAVRPHPTQRCVAVSTHSILWPQLLPQHGPGRKHTRSIRLRPWQLKHTRAEPRVRTRADPLGRIPLRRRGAAAGKDDDIKAIFCAHLDLLGIRWTRPNEKDIAIARKADVALLDAFIGPKR